MMSWLQLPVTSPVDIVREVMPWFDYSISLSDILIFMGGLIAFLKVSVGVRDSMRDMARQIGSKDPPDGLLGDVQGLKYEARKRRDGEIELRAQLGMKQQDRT
jgi:hypothetical protein